MMLCSHQLRLIFGSSNMHVHNNNIGKLIGYFASYSGHKHNIIIHMYVRVCVCVGGGIETGNYMTLYMYMYDSCRVVFP